MDVKDKDKSFINRSQNNTDKDHGHIFTENEAYIKIFIIHCEKLLVSMDKSILFYRGCLKVTKKEDVKINAQKNLDKVIVQRDKFVDIIKKLRERIPD